MTITTISSRNFNQCVSEAKKSANKGLVFITDRGKTSHVLMNFEDYKRLTKQRRNIAEALSMPGVEDIEFNPPRINIGTKEEKFEA